MHAYRYIHIHMYTGSYHSRTTVSSVWVCLKQPRPFCSHLQTSFYTHSFSHMWKEMVSKRWERTWRREWVFRVTEKIGKKEQEMCSCGEKHSHCIWAASSCEGSSWLVCHPSSFRRLYSQWYLLDGSGSNSSLQLQIITPFFFSVPLH